MSEHPINEMMVTAMENLKEMIDVKTIVGDPIETADQSTIILPISKVGFGFASGGSELTSKSKSSSDDEYNSDMSQQQPFCGGTGGGVSITPIAFLIVSRNEVKTVHLDDNTHIIEKLIDLAPEAVEKIQMMWYENKGQLRRRKGDRNIPD